MKGEIAMIEKDTCCQDTCCLLVTGGTETGKTVAACNVFSHLTLGGGVKTTTPNGKEVRFALVADPQSATAGADIDTFTNDYLHMLNGEPLPHGSPENHSYELLFQDNGKNICSILYLDYRGGLTRDRDTENEQYKKENNELDYMMEHSTLLIYIIPGDVLNDYISLQGKDNIVTMTAEERTKYVEVSGEVSQINTLIQRAGHNKAPLLFYVTKSDLVYNEKEIIPGLERLIRQFGLWQKGRKALGCHSTLGRNVVIKKEIAEDGSAIKRVDTGFDPVGFEIPMMLTVGYRMSAQGKAWANAELGRIQNEIDSITDIIDDNQVSEALEKKKISNRIKGFVLRRPVQAITDLQKDIDDDKQRVTQLKAELNQVDGRNVQKGFSEDILSYLNEHHGKSILYIDEEGRSRPLSEFFE